MIKTARKPSTDPAQEKLRNDKATWNKDVSAFVNDIIHLKKLMNGWPSKFYMERSFIKEPMPADPATIIGSLLGDYQSIAERGNKIVQEQLDYSRTRKKRQPKQMNLPFPAATPAPAAPSESAAPAPDLTQQLALPLAAAQQYELIAEGSNPVTRFFTRLLTPTIGWSDAARIRRYRMSLLGQCVKVFKDLEQLQLEVVKSSDESLTSANKILHKTWNDWMIINKGFVIYKSNMPAIVLDTGGEIAPPKGAPPKDRASKDQDQETSELNTDPNAPIRGDYEHEPKDQDVIAPPSTKEQTNANEALILASAAIKDYKAFLEKDRSNLRIKDEAIYGPFHELASKFIMPPARNRIHIALPLVKMYREIIAQLNAKLGTSGNSLTEILALVNSAAAKTKIQPAIPIPPKGAQMEVMAQKFLRKWLGKTRHSIFTNKSSAYRLDVYKMAGETRRIINRIMDQLEKGMDVESIDVLIGEVNGQMTKLRGIMRALHLSNPPKTPKGKEVHTPGIWESLT